MKTMHFFKNQSLMHERFLNKACIDTKTKFEKKRKPITEYTWF